MSQVSFSSASSPDNANVEAKPEVDTSTLSFECFWEDDNLVRAVDKQRYILAAAHGVVEDFSFESEPYLLTK